MSELVVGVDGYARGWVAVEVRDGSFAGAKTFRGFAGIVEAHAGAACIAVDIPIGGGPRSADKDARSFVGPRWASVFYACTRSKRSLASRTSSGIRVG